MSKLFLFTDGSVNTKSNIGYGAFLAIPADMKFAEVRHTDIKLKRFEETSSTKLEIQTMLWALNKVRKQNTNLTVYTDSQNIIGLQRRRNRLEKNNFFSKSGRRINNFELYQQFYQLIDELNCEFIKIKGHKKSGEKNQLEQLFTLVDRASRNAVRNEKE